LRNAQKQLGADGWEGVVVLDYDGIIPQAAEFADLPMELDAFNDFAESVKAMPSREKQLPKLKALLEHFGVTDLAAAAGLVEHIGDYILTPEISSPQEAAIDELTFTISSSIAASQEMWWRTMPRPDSCMKMPSITTPCLSARMRSVFLATPISAAPTATEKPSV